MNFMPYITFCIVVYILTFLVLALISSKPVKKIAIGSLIFTLAAFIIGTVVKYLTLFNGILRLIVVIILLTILYYYTNK